MGDDAKMLRTVTDPTVVGLRLLPPDWDVDSLLKAVASLQPPAHALIDCGALCTGMTNAQARATAVGTASQRGGSRSLQIARDCSSTS